MFETYSFYGNPLLVDNISIAQQNEDLELKIFNWKGQLVHKEILATQWE